MEDLFSIRDLLLGGLVTLPVLLAFNWIKNMLDRRAMRKDMARLLYNELRANRDEIIECKKTGIPRRASAINGVYNGLISSGNIKYLRERQIALYRLYVSMARNDASAIDLISGQMKELQTIFKRIE